MDLYFYFINLILDLLGSIKRALRYCLLDAGYGTFYLFRKEFEVLYDFSKTS